MGFNLGKALSGGFNEAVHQIENTGSNAISQISTGVKDASKQIETGVKDVSKEISSQPQQFVDGLTKTSIIQ